MVSTNTNALRDALVRLPRGPTGPLVEVATDKTPLPARAVGQRFAAQLVADLPNGRSLIDVQGVRLDVKLPVRLAVGDTLHLEVVELEPRLTFALIGTPAGTGAD